MVEWYVKDLEGNGLGPNEVLYWHLPGDAFSSLCPYISSTIFPFLSSALAGNAG
jgi:hypothetical protein